MKIRLGALAVSGVVICCGGATEPAPGDDAAGGAGGASSADGGSSSNGASSGNAGNAGIGGSGGSGGYGDITTGGAAGTAPATFTLTVTVNGEGRVTSTPAGIDCGSECQGTFAAGTHVQLATREQGGVLTGWSEACTGGSACSVTLDADARATATFEPFTVGANAHGVAVTPDGARALVTLGDSAGTLKLVSLSDGSIVDSITVGSFPGAVAVTPDGTKAVVNNLRDVSIVTLSTKAVATVASPCAGDTLYDIAVTPDGASAVTTMFNGTCLGNTVAMVGLGSPSLGSTYPIPAQLTGGIAVTADGGSALVALGILGSKVSRVALSGGAITDIAGTSASFGIAVTPDGSEALVASGDGDTIKRVSLSSNSVTGSIAYGSNQDPHNLAITPDGSLAVAVGSFDVGVLSLATGTVAKTFSGGGRSVAITPDGKRALVTQGSTLRVFAL